jgi:hypothetical protein
MFHYLIHASSVFIVKLEKYKSRYISHIALLHVKENKKKRIMPPEAENTKSEASKWESKVSA